MKKITILVLLLMIVACKSDKPDKDYREGSDGIIMSFMELDPIIYEGSPLYVIAELHNKGAYSENYGKVLLRGFDPRIMPFDGTGEGNMVKRTLPEIEGKGPYNKDGSTDTVTFEIPENHIYLPTGEVYEPTLVLSSCYYYETLATPKVCIVPDLSNMDQGTCKPKAIKMTDQGAPVAVTKVEENVMEGYVTFIATIEHVGTGKVVALSEKGYNNCPHNLQYDDINEVKVEMSMLNTAIPSCEPEEYVKLSGGKGIMMCKFQIRPEQMTVHDLENRDDSYEKELSILVQYNYLEEIKKTIRIEKMPGSGTGNGDNGKEPDDPVNPITPVTNLNCPCDKSAPEHVPCVCMYIGSEMKICQGKDGENADYTVSQKEVVAKIAASDYDEIDQCGITGQIGPCTPAQPYEVRFNFDRPGTVKKAVIGMKGSGIVASQYCTIRYDGNE